MPNLTEATTTALNILAAAQDQVRNAHGAAQTGSIGLAGVRQDLARRLGRLTLDIVPLKAEMESLVVAARILDTLEREEQVRLAAAQRDNRRPRPP